LLAGDLILRPSEQYPADLELTPDEKEKYNYLMNNYKSGEAWNFNQACLLRKRLNALNGLVNMLYGSSKRIEKATYLLLAATLVLLVVTLVSAFG